MPWSPVITNIVTEPSLAVTLDAYVKETDNTTTLQSKLDRVGGIAQNLKLSGGSQASDDAASVLYVNTTVSSATTSITSKAPINNPTFTGTVIVPNGIGPTSAVNLSQLQGYLPLSGGTVTGLIKTSVAPVVGNDLTNKTYVDNSILTLENLFQDDYVRQDSAIFTSVIHANTPPYTAYGDEVATADFVRNYTGGTTLSVGTYASDESVDAKLDLFAPKHGAELSGSPTIIGETPSLEEDSNTIATTAWVQALINDRLGTL